jgi:hypothetical protein
MPAADAFQKTQTGPGGRRRAMLSTITGRAAFDLCIFHISLALLGKLM